MTDPIRVAVSGINGKMGRASAAAVLADEELVLAGGLEREGAECIGASASDLLACSMAPGQDFSISASARECFELARPDVVIDFTVAEAAVNLALLAIESGVRPVIGTSGMEPAYLERIEQASEKAKVGSMVVPNFSVGAVLMMEFARIAGKHFENTEIVEMHHTGKVDAPSGTAMHTARKLAESRARYNQRDIEEKELLAGSRGGLHESGIRVHSLRLPGLISHQEVLFGSDGEMLAIKHDSFNTSCFSRGIVMAIKAVTKMDRLVVGLETLL